MDLALAAGALYRCRFRNVQDHTQFEDSAAVAASSSSRLTCITPEWSHGPSTTQLSVTRSNVPIPHTSQALRESCSSSAQVSSIQRHHRRFKGQGCPPPLRQSCPMRLSKTHRCASSKSTSCWNSQATLHHFSTANISGPHPMRHRYQPTLPRTQRTENSARRVRMRHKLERALILQEDRNSNHWLGQFKEHGDVWLL